MAMIPYIEEQIATNPQTMRLAANAMQAAYGVGSQLLSSGKQKRKKRRLRRARKRAANNNSRFGSTAALALPAPNVGRSRASIQDRRMSAPVAYGSRIKQDYSGLDTYRVRHAEFVADITGSVNFSVTQFRVNPADPILFPWLSALAPNFEKYHFKKLDFQLKPQAPSTKPGVVMLALDYDPVDLPPVSKADMLQYDGAVRTNTWSEQDLLMKNVSDKYTSPVLPADSADIRLSDAANLFVAVAGQDNTDAISELWVNYEVELKIPQARTTCDTFRLNTLNWDATAPFLNSMITNSSVNFVLGSGAAEILVTRSGQYSIVCQAYGLSEDLPTTAPYLVEVFINGVQLSNSEHAAGEADVALLVTETFSLSTRLKSAYTLVPGDVIKFIPTSVETPALIIHIYSWN